jgi:hypothetical protein
MGQTPNLTDGTFRYEELFPTLSALLAALTSRC